jgi:Transposase and inactivated derivatives
MTIYAGSINRDHVHMLISIPPQLSVSRAVQYLKGKSSHKLLSEYGQGARGRNGAPVNPSSWRAIGAAKAHGRAIGDASIGSVDRDFDRRRSCEVDQKLSDAIVRGHVGLRQ